MLSKRLPMDVSQKYMKTMKKKHNVPAGLFTSLLDFSDHVDVKLVKRIKKHENVAKHNTNHTVFKKALTKDDETVIELKSKHVFIAPMGPIFKKKKKYINVYKQTRIFRKIHQTILFVSFY